jgi:hypothetical protein
MGPSPLKPVEAIAWHETRVPMTKQALSLLKASAQKRAFTVAGVANADLIAGVQEALAGALVNGTTLEDFKAAVGAKLEAEWMGTVKNPAARLETIFRTNVQCLVPGQFVEGRFVAASKASYAGDVLQLRTEAGRRLTVTPNHPILTPHGFVAAQDLRNGDDVLGSAGNIERGAAFGLVKEGKKNGPALVEDVYRSFAGESGRSVRRTLGPLDLHGDAMGTDGQIHVVRSYGELLRDIKAHVLERIRELVFSLSYAEQSLIPCLGRSDLLFERHAAAADGFPGWSHGQAPSRLSLVGHPGPLHALGLGRAASLMASALEHPVYLPHGQTEAAGQGWRRIAALVAIYDAALNILGKGNLQPTRLGPASDLDASVSESARQHGRANPDFLGKLLHGSSGLIATDKIVEIGNGFFRGHVYDLQTEGGWYLSQQTCISNCAYNAGRYAQANDPDTRTLRPFWQFDAVTDARTTPGCRAANGTVRPADDPWWSHNLPPRHFNCRATFHPLTRRQAERMGITEKPPAIKADDGFGGPPAFHDAPTP